jgi:hypothetical protein
MKGNIEICICKDNNEQWQWPMNHTCLLALLSYKQPIKVNITFFISDKLLERFLKKGKWTPGGQKMYGTTQLLNTTTQRIQINSCILTVYYCRLEI